MWRPCSALASIRIWLAAALALAARAGAEPVVSFVPPDVVASGLTAGGSAVWFGVEHELGVDEETEGLTVVVQEAIVTDADQDGMVSFALGGEPASKTLFTALDLATGEVGVGTPPNFPRADIPPEQVALVEGSELDTLWVGRFLAEILVLRPGAGGGAWRLRTGDGAPSDVGVDLEGEVEVELASFTGVGEGAPPPPAAYQAGDVVTIYDPDRMEVYVGKVEEGPGEAAGDLRLVPLLGGGS